MKTSGASHLKNVVLPKQMVCAEATCGTQRQSKVGIKEQIQTPHDPRGFY